MKRVTLKKGLTMAMMLLAGSIYSQTPVNNLIRLTSLGPLSGGTTSLAGPPISLISQDDSSITIDPAGVVTIASDYTPIAASGNTTGTVLIGGAKNKTISIQLNAGSVVDQTAGVTYGAITTTAGIQRASAGDIGVTTNGASSGIDNGEGLTFGLDLSSLPSTVAVQISAVYFTTFGTAESCTVINRQDTSKNTTVVGFSGNSGRRDISTLGISIPGGTVDFDAASFFSPNLASSFRIAGIEIRIVALSTTWNGTSWSNTAPGPAVDAFIEGNYSTGTSGGFSAKNLTVNSGSLVIDQDPLATPPNKNLKIELDVTNNAGPSGIIVKEGCGLQVVQSTGTSTGAITVEKSSNSLFRNDYSMWSSPVSGTQKLEDFSPLTSQSPNNRFYTYDASTNLYTNVAPTIPFGVTTGYLIRMPNENPAELGTSSNYFLGTSPITFNGVFVGVPNNGNITRTGLTSDSYYSVGNPYPSNIDADLFLAGNSTGGTLYFWRKTNGAVGTAYATYTTAGGVANGGFAAPNKFIAPCQGFIVKTGAAATSLTFTNAMRANMATPPIFQKTKQEVTNRVWLNLTNATGSFNQALIAYMDGATNGVDNGIDGEYINDSKVALTSSINNAEYVIQGRPAFDASDVVALNFKTDIAGDYSIALDHFDGVFATGQAVYLVDSKTGVETDLKVGGYNFTAAAGVDNARFSLKYQKTLKVIDSEFNDNSVTVYANKGTLYVKSVESAISNIKVFDIQGRLLHEQNNVKSNTATISNLKSQQALIVQVISEENDVVTKKVLN